MKKNFYLFFLNLCLFYDNFMLIYVKIMKKNLKKKILIHVNFMLIYLKITDRQTDKHIKTIVRNLTKNFG